MLVVPVTPVRAVRHSGQAVNCWALTRGSMERKYRQLLGRSGLVSSQLWAQSPSSHRHAQWLSVQGPRDLPASTRASECVTAVVGIHRSLGKLAPERQANIMSQARSPIIITACHILTCVTCCHIGLTIYIQPCSQSHPHAASVHAS